MKKWEGSIETPAPSASRPKFLVAGSLPYDVEDFLFRTARVRGAVCARVSGMDAWLRMVSEFEFGAVFVGMDGEHPEAVEVVERGRLLVPGIPIVTMGGVRTPAADFHVPLEDIQSVLPGIVDRLVARSEVSGA